MADTNDNDTFEDRLRVALSEQRNAAFIDEAKRELLEIANRLDRANAYKETFGADIAEIKHDIQSLKNQAQLFLPSGDIKLMIGNAMEENTQRHQRYWAWLTGIAVGIAATVTTGAFVVNTVLHLVK